MDNNLGLFVTFVLQKVNWKHNVKFYLLVEIITECPQCDAESKKIPVILPRSTNKTRNRKSVSRRAGTNAVVKYPLWKSIFRIMPSSSGDHLRSCFFYHKKY
jgi:hypothetical protein